MSLLFFCFGFVGCSLFRGFLRFSLLLVVWFQAHGFYKTGWNLTLSSVFDKLLLHSDINTLVMKGSINFPSWFISPVHWATKLNILKIDSRPHLLLLLPTVEMFDYQVLPQSWTEILIYSQWRILLLGLSLHASLPWLFWGGYSVCDRQMRDYKQM